MRPKLIPVLGALAAGGLMFLLFQPDDAATSTVPSRQRRTMPELRMATLDGSPWSLASRRGKVVLVNFWASWCSPCREETPGLVRIARSYAGKGVEVAGVSLDDTTAPVRQFVTRFGVDYPVLIPPPDSPLASGIESIPTTILVDRQGRVAKTYVGAISETVFRKDIEDALAGG